MAVCAGTRHPQLIETTSPSFPRRHASAFAVTLLVLSLSAAVVTVWIDRTGALATKLFNNPGATASQLLCFGTAGAVLIARRPDLPFGWLLGLGALADIVFVGGGVPSFALLDAGSAEQLAWWGISLGALQWVPDVVPGLVNVRFPSGTPAGRPGWWLDRCLRVGLVIGLIGNFSGDTVTDSVDTVLGGDVTSQRFIDGSWITPVGDATSILVPLLILLGALAGVGVVIRCFKATGVERKQLQWRAVGAVVGLAGFPLAFSGLLPPEFFVLEPVVFAATLLVPMLRYQLWSGDPVPRRRRIGLLVSRRTLVESREEERRRLRRDLHDGIGPLLTGLRLNLDAVQAQLSDDPPKALEYLAEARRASAKVITDLRELAYDLRPPAIDELGLVGALRARLALVSEDEGLDITLDGEDELPLPAAVEVALYLCATEAVANVVRHGNARRCRVTLTSSRKDVTLMVDDDGGVSGDWQAGVGLSSMRERATELGGTFLASSGPDGFHVRATYPRKDA
jgi:signal transduction histidine kinase